MYIKYTLLFISLLLFSACGVSPGNTSGSLPGGSGSGGGSGSTADTQAPTLPTNLSALAVSANRIDLSWDPAVDDVGIAGYSIYRNNAYLTDVSTNSYTDTGLAMSTAYCYAIVAFDAAGNVSAATVDQCATTIDAWTIRNLADNFESLQTIASSGSKYIAGGSTSIYLSEDGVSWTPYAGGFYGPGGLNYIEWDGTRFIAAWGTKFYTTVDGLSWSSVSTGGFADFRDIIGLASNGSGKIVAVGTEGLLKFSADNGATWNDATTTLDSMTYVADVLWDGNKFIAVAGNDTILYSSDGDNWTIQTVTTTNGWGFTSLVWNGSLYIAGSRSQVATSSNGIDWTVSDITGYIEHLEWSDSLGLFVSAGLNGLVYTSMDGATWTAHTILSEFPSLNDVIWSGNQFYAVGDASSILTSNNGSNWSTQLFGTHLENVTWLNNQFIGMGGSGKLMSSSDGLNWTHYFTGDLNDWIDSIAWSGSEYMLTGQVYYSSASLDNITTKHSIGAGVITSPVVWNGSEFVTLRSGFVYKSTDGTSYSSTATNIDPYNSMNDLNWNGTQYVAVGTAGTIYTSTDAVTWTQQTSGTTNTLYKIIWSGSQYLAVGYAGTVLTSADGISWTLQTSGTSSTLYTATWTGTAYYAAGSSVILTSGDGITWNTMSLPAGIYPTIKGIGWNGSRLVAVGDNGLIMTLH